jgi:protoporphyrinogen oxidase
MPRNNKVVIIGAGPAGLTAGYELTKHGHAVTVLEKDPKYVGGIARTVDYKGYKFDIGGHRFFSKSQEIENLWSEIIGADMLERPRLSRIYYQKKFYHYPLKPINALMNMGIIPSLQILYDYFLTRIRPIHPEKSFADWVINRFGRKLYLTFFKSYTEKVWGISCDEISADWAAQRIKGLSLTRAVLGAFVGRSASGETVKTLIDKFRYPKYGPGMVWEKTRELIRSQQGEVLNDQAVETIHHDAGRVTSVTTRDSQGTQNEFVGEHFISSMPMRELVRYFSPVPNARVLAAGDRLKYRDFLTVVLVINQAEVFPDNWIYIHEPSVKVGRIQNFKNWSPAMVPDARMTSLGLEYFCFEGDGLWRMSDADLVSLGTRELAELGLVNSADVVDGTVVRMPKAYPVYDEDYKENVSVIRDYLGQFKNIQVVGRNGMHKYNNQDHAMMTALLAARNIMGGDYDVWKVNTDAEYHEQQSESDLEKAGRQVPTKNTPE